MRRYAPYAAALSALAFLAWAIWHNLSGVDSPDVAAVGRSDSPRPELPIPSARVLLTTDDLQRLTGDEYQLGHAPTDIPTMTQCTYDGPEQIALTIVVGQGAPLRYLSSQEFSDHVPVPDLGDEAVWVPSIGTLAVLDQQGDLALQIEVREQELSTEQDEESVSRRRSLAESIAVQVLDRLHESSQ